MKKIGVIIKHAFRDNDYRIDIYIVKEEMGYEGIYNYILSQMLGPFEILAITENISFDCKIK